MNHYPQSFNLDEELQKFRNYAFIVGQAGHFVSVGPDVVKFVPNIKKTKNLKIGFMALTHGNEIIGLPIVNRIMQMLLSGAINATSELYFALGNVEAAYLNKRFVEKDLNRCFKDYDSHTLENKRALILEECFLNKIDYLIDLHQTIQKSSGAFFIFQYSSLKCFSHLALMNDDIPTVLQLDAIGEQQGLSSDEYLRSRGRFGAALELGQIGISDELFQTGFEACLKLLNRTSNLSGFDDKHFDYLGDVNFPVFEMSSRLLAIADETELAVDLQNFSFIRKGQIVGVNPSGDWISAEQGVLLFPKLGQKIKAGQSAGFICLDIRSSDKIILQDVKKLCRRSSAEIQL